VKKNP